MQSNFPSIKTLTTRLNITPEKAKIIRFIFTANRNDLLDNINGITSCIPNTIKWVKSCYNIPALNEIRIEAINEVLECYGVEYCESISGDYLSYCEAGDTYICTVCYYKGRFIVSSWGDIVEKGNFK